MAQPFLGSGVTPWKGSTLRMLLMKHVVAIGGSGVNSVKRGDTVRMLRLKIERVRSGKTNPA